MRIIILLFFTSFSNFRTSAQLSGHGLQKPIFILKYAETLKDCHALYIPTQFGQSDFSDTNEFLSLQNSEILAIDLVYTDYPKGDPFYKLNKARLLKLQEMLSGFNLNSVTINLYRQNGAIDKSEAKKDYHGFVIYYKKPNIEIIAQIDSTKMPAPDSVVAVNIPEKKSRDSAVAPFISEADFIQSLIDFDFNKDSIDKMRTVYCKPLVDSIDQVYFDCYSIKRKRYYDSLKFGRVEIYTREKIIKKGLLNKFNHKYFKDCERFMYVSTRIPTPNPLSVLFTNDSTVSKVMKRNPWNNMMVCADVTSSMTPHIVQLMIWLKLNANNRSMRYFTAFNDGDSTADKKKKIGKTGGIYSTDSWNYLDVAKTVHKAISAGNGGDNAENDIEGLLDGQENSKDCENFILIADNYAPVKDMALLRKINKPIKVIVCGAEFGINPDYLNIARKSGGSVHTIEDDITNLALLKEGEIFEFKGRQYKIKGGSFIDITVNETKL